MEAGRISFLPRAIYDVLPSPRKLQLWVGEDPSCPLCSSPATLRHILTGCKVRLSQGRYTWRHNQVLKCLAAAIESKSTSHDTQYSTTVEQEWRRTSPLTNTGQWREPGGSVGQRLTIPAKIVTTTLWSATLQFVYFIELTLPWEDVTEEANERKKLRYAEMANNAHQQ